MEKDKTNSNYVKNVYNSFNCKQKTNNIKKNTDDKDSILEMKKNIFKTFRSNNYYKAKLSRKTLAKENNNDDNLEL